MIYSLVSRSGLTHVSNPVLTWFPSDRVRDKDIISRTARWSPENYESVETGMIPRMMIPRIMITSRFSRT